MKPARIRDVPALAWLIASHGSEKTTSGLSQALLLPVSLLMTYAALPCLHHNERRSMAVLTGPLRRAVHSWPTLCLQLILSCLLLFGLYSLPTLIFWLLLGAVPVSLAAFVWAFPGSAQRTPPGTWTIGMLVGRPGSYAIADAAQLARKCIRPGETVAAIARDEGIAEIYCKRYKFERTHPGALKLTYSAPGYSCWPPAPPR